MPEKRSRFDWYETVEQIECVAEDRRILFTLTASVRENG